MMAGNMSAGYFRKQCPAMKKRFSFLAALTASAVVLVGCTSSDPTGGEDAADADGAASAETIVIGTANFPESEIIGQVWAAALEEEGFDVEVNSGIGSREVYTGAIEEGSVQVFPEYIGSLAQYYDADVSVGADSDEVAAALSDVLPEALAIGELAPGQNADSFQVLPDTAEEYDLTTIGDLANIDEIVLATQPETMERPFGPEGLETVYGVPADSIELNAISDGGGPLTVSALVQGAANVANIYTTTPTYDSDGNPVELVTLEDPESIILPENVTALYRADDVPAEVLDVLNGVNADLTTERLIEFNERNIGEEKADPSVIAEDFIAERD
jgi:osmoprotectant transport system substrate-binding protein